MRTSDQCAATILAAVLEIPDAGGRRVYLDRACGDDPVLRREVESLLAAHEQAGEFMNTGAMVGSAPSVPTEKAGDRIGRYRLLEQIGEGGFGVVWMAEQEEPVRRRVALKIIKLGMDTKEVVARFEVERQALALMDHPHIAKVFDGGAIGVPHSPLPALHSPLLLGRPYFVMELVRGIPITQYCDARQLSPTDRLELFMAVCHAVQHAHQKGVIHRDLKPSNILVTEQDGRAVPKVIDFGLAKATQARLTEKTLFTHFRQWIGTPAYMSPEQAGLASLDVDTRSDVYALGVLLYELLTGRPPFDTEKLLAAGYEAVMRTIREEEPPKPSTRISTLAKAELEAVAARRGADPARLDRLVRGDLDWIVMKALEKDRVRRYETAESLRLDLQHFLAHEPVAARPPSALYRLRKVIRRHRLAVGAASAVVWALILGLGLSTHLFLKEQEARKRAVAAEQAERVLRQKAQMGETSARALQYWNEGRWAEAEVEQRAALALWRAQLGGEHPQVAAAMDQLATILRDEGKLDEAVATYRQALELKRRAFQTEPAKWEAGLKRLAETLNERGVFGAERLLGEVLPQAQARLQTIELLREQASVSARRGHWQEAILKYSRLIDEQPGNPVPYHALAALLAHTTDRTNYDHFCTETQARFPVASDAVVAGALARDCLLMPTARIEETTVARWLDVALATGTNHWAAPTFELTRGLAEYRRGRHAESVDWLGRALSREHEPGRRAQALFISAMAQAGLGQTNAATAALAQGVEIVETRLPRIESGPLGDGWIEWLIAYALRREARGVFEDRGFPH
jgi:serine/threonine protein kinase/tetratricopeptide (TPR) repeat protein